MDEGRGAKGTGRGTPPTVPGALGPSTGTGTGRDPVEAYQRVAETVGMMPSVRWKDNLVQAAVVLVGIVLGAGIGYAVGRNVVGLIAGGVIGMIVSTLLSGFVLMVLGFTRVAKKK